MPPALPIVAAIAPAVFTTTAFSIGIAAVSWGTVISIGASALFLVTQDKPKLSASDLDPGSLQTIRTNTASRTLEYGEMRTGGVLVYANTNGGDTNEYLNLIIALGWTEIESIDEIYFGDNLAVNASGTVQSPYSGFLNVIKKLGAEGQTSSSTLQSYIGSDWTSDHRLQEIPYIGLRLKWDQDVYPEGIPNVTVKRKGKLLYDPRDQGTRYSNNPALVLRDYLNSTKYGLGIPSDEIDDASFIIAANICDESIPLSGGGTEPRYTCNGSIDTAGDPSDALQKICQSMAGTLIYSAGKFSALAGAWTEPVADLGEADIVENIRVVTATSKRENYNAVSGQFANAEDNYVIGDYPPLESDTLAARDGDDVGNPISGGSITVGSGYRINSLDGGADFTGVGADENTVGLIFIATGANPTWGSGGVLQEKELRRVYQSVDYPFTTSSSMAQRISKISLLEMRQEIVVEATFRLCEASWKALPGENIRLSISRMGWTNKIFRVLSWQDAPIEGESGGPIAAIRMTLKETAEVNYDWATSEEQEIDPAPNTNLPDPRTVGAPTNLTLETGSAHLYLKKDGTAVTRIFVDWEEPSDSFVKSGGMYEVQYKRASDSNYIALPTVNGGSTSQYIWDVEENVNYNVRVRSINVLGVVSAWVSSSLVASGKVSAPSSPSALTFSATNFGLRISWGQSLDSDVIKYQLQRSNLDLSVASWQDVGESLTNFFDFVYSPFDTDFWRVRAIDRSGNRSNWTTSAVRSPTTRPTLANNWNENYPITESVTAMFANSVAGVFGSTGQFDLEFPNGTGQLVSFASTGFDFHVPTGFSTLTTATGAWDVCWRRQSGGSYPTRPNSSVREPTGWSDSILNDINDANSLYFFMIKPNGSGNWLNNGYGPWYIFNLGAGNQ